MYGPAQSIASLCLACHYHPDHPIQTLFGLLPVRHYLPHEPVEAFAVVMLGQMAELMQDNVIDTLTRGLHQIRVQGHLSIRGTTSPLSLHGKNTQWW